MYGIVLIFCLLPFAYGQNFTTDIPYPNNSDVFSVQEMRRRYQVIEDVMASMVLELLKDDVPMGDLYDACGIIAGLELPVLYYAEKMIDLKRHVCPESEKQIPLLIHKISLLNDYIKEDIELKVAKMVEVCYDIYNLHKVWHETGFVKVNLEMHAQLIEGLKKTEQRLQRNKS
uniref:Uncharacterized protein n=1 Tax=Clastoptera arizonana TaxID=38151 RepID=A0A1B6DJD1_9HEMI